MQYMGLVNCNYHPGIVLTGVQETLRMNHSLQVLFHDSVARGLVHFMCDLYLLECDKN